MKYVEMCGGRGSAALSGLEDDAPDEDEEDEDASAMRWTGRMMKLCKQVVCVEGVGRVSYVPVRRE